MKKPDHFIRSDKPKYIVLDNSMGQFWLFYLDSLTVDSDSVGFWRIKYKNHKLEARKTPERDTNTYLPI